MRMTMRKFVVRTAALAMFGCALGAVSLMAQDTPPPAGQAEGGPRGGPGRGRMMNGTQQLETMTKELGLTTDQVAQVKIIDADTMKQMVALRDDTTIAQPDKRPKMMAIHAASQAKVRAILTEDQKPKFDAMEAKMRERMAGRGGRMGGGPDGTPPPAPPQ